MHIKMPFPPNDKVAKAKTELETKQRWMGNKNSHFSNRTILLVREKRSIHVFVEIVIDGAVIQTAHLTYTHDTTVLALIDAGVSVSVSVRRDREVYKRKHCLYNLWFWSENANGTIPKNLYVWIKNARHTTQHSTAHVYSNHKRANRSKSRCFKSWKDWIYNRPIILSSNKLSCRYLYMLLALCQLWKWQHFWSNANTNHIPQLLSSSANLVLDYTPVKRAVANCK